VVVDIGQVIRGSDAWILRPPSQPAGSHPPGAERFHTALYLLNGRLAAAEAVIAPAGRAVRLIDLRLAPFVPQRDVRDLASLDWHVFPKTRAPVLPRVLQAHTTDHFVLAACAPLSVLRLPFWRQVRGGDRPDSVPEPDPPSVEVWRCPWPDIRVVRSLDPQRRTGALRRLILPFWTYRQFFDRDPWREVPFARRGLEYARYVRRLRTALWWCLRCGAPVRPVVGQIWHIRAGLLRRGRDPADPASWDGDHLRRLVRPMPAIFFDLIENVPGSLAAVSPGSVVLGAQRLSAVPWCPGADCMACVVLADGRQVARLFVWFNWLEIGPTIEPVVARLADFAESRGWFRILWLVPAHPFVSDRTSGDLDLRLPGDFPSEWFDESTDQIF